MKLLFEGLILAAVAGFGIYFCRQKEKKYFIALYIVWWSIWLLSSTTKRNNTYAIRDTVYLLMLISIVSFTIGFVFLSQLHFPNLWKPQLPHIRLRNDRLVQKACQKIWKYKYCIAVISAFAINLYLLYYVIRYNTLLAQYGMPMGRTIRFSLGYLFLSNFEVQIYQYIVYPLIVIFYMMSCYQICRGLLKKQIIFITLSFLAILLYAMIGNGRIILFECIIYFIMCCYLLNCDHLWCYLKANKKMILISMAIGIGALFAMSYVRFGNSLLDIANIPKFFDKIFAQGEVYFSGAMKGFQYALDHDYRGIIVKEYGPTYGWATFGGLNQLISFIPNTIGNLSGMLGDLLQEGFKIGPHTVFNAFFTCNLNFFIDFGYLGIIFCPCLYGCFISRIIDLRQRKNIFIHLFIIFNLSFAVFSSYRWYYQQAFVFIIFIILWLLNWILKRGMCYEKDAG